MLAKCRRTCPAGRGNYAELPGNIFRVKGAHLTSRQSKPLQLGKLMYLRHQDRSFMNPVRRQMDYEAAVDESMRARMARFAFSAAPATSPSGSRASRSN